MTKIRHHIGKLALAVAVALLLMFAAPVRAADPPPTLVVDLRNLPVTGAAAVLTSSLTYVAPSGRTGSLAYRVTVSVTGTASVFNVDHGTDVFVAALNGGTALTADCVYTFTFSATDQDAVNFTFTTTTTITRLIVEEIRGGQL